MIQNQYFNQDILDFNGFPEYDILYTDTPWGERMVKQFQTMMFKQTGIKVNNTLIQILTHLGKHASKDKPMFIEYGINGWEEMVEIMQSCGHKLNEVKTLYQSMNRPFIVASFNTTMPIPDKKGFEVVKTILRSVAPTGKVFDPFAGIGQTKKAVNSVGWSYIGSELNPARYQRLIRD